MNTKMNKVHVQIIDTKSGISQTGKIEEPVKSGLEINNALAHFGVNYGEVEWLFTQKEVDYEMKCGKISGTTKVVNIVMLFQVVSDQPSNL